MVIEYLARARPHGGHFNTLSRVNHIVAPCGRDYCLYDTSKKLRLRGKL